MSYIVEKYPLLTTEFGEVSCLKISNYPDAQIEEKVNGSIRDYVLSLKNDIGPVFLHMYTTYESNNYISIKISIAIHDGKARGDKYIYYTLDLKTGQPVFLSDLVETNDEFFDLLRKGDIIEATYSLLIGEEGDRQAAREGIVEAFQFYNDEIVRDLCNPIVVINDRMMNGFFLNDDAIVLHLLQTRGDPFDFYSVPFERIRDFLKVDFLNDSNNLQENNTMSNQKAID